MNKKYIAINQYFPTDGIRPSIKQENLCLQSPTRHALQG